MKVQYIIFELFFLLGFFLFGYIQLANWCVAMCSAFVYRTFEYPVMARSGLTRVNASHAWANPCPIRNLLCLSVNAETVNPCAGSLPAPLVWGFLGWRLAMQRDFGFGWMDHGSVTLQGSCGCRSGFPGWERLGWIDFVDEDGFLYCILCTVVNYVLAREDS